MNPNRSILKSERIKLVLTEEEHLEKRVAFINNPKVQQTLNFDYPTSLSKTKKWFDQTLLDNSRVDFSVIDRATQKVIGFCGLMNIEVPVMKAETYTIIGDTSYWGKGYGRDTNKLLYNYGFIELGLNRLYGYILTHNEKNLKNADALGRKVEGRFRKSIFSHGKLRDQYLVAIVRSDWEKNDVYDI